MVERAKIRDYCLSLSHPRGKHKARVFASALGITQADAESLPQQLLQAARDGEAVQRESDQYGHRYTIDLRIVRGTREATIRSFWIIRRQETFPRLTTCFVLLD